MVKLFHPAALAAAAVPAGHRPTGGAIIRAATPADRPALATLAATAFARGQAALVPAKLRPLATAARFETLFSGTAPLLVAQAGMGAATGLLGCALAESPDAETGTGRLSGLWVAQSAEGQGIGSALLAGLEDWLAAEGMRQLRIRVPGGHLRAIGLFRRRGYVMQAAGLRLEPVLQAMLPQTVLAKPLSTPAPLAA